MDLNSSKNFHKQLYEKTKNLEMISKPIAVALLDLAREHAAAIPFLIENTFYGSASALLRSALEAYVRGIWVEYCANDNNLETVEDIDKHFNKNEVTFQCLINDIKQKPQGIKQIGEGIERSKNLNWKLFNDFTHGGINQIVGRIISNRIESNFPPDVIESMIQFSNEIAALVTIQFAVMADNKQFLCELMKDENIIKTLNITVRNEL